MSYALKSNVNSLGQGSVEVLEAGQVLNSLNSAKIQEYRPHAKLKCLQAGRGLAAILVLLFHLNVSIFGLSKYFPHVFWSGFSFGRAGIYYFFVLSGYIIAYVHWQDIGKPGHLVLFLRKRFVRIYPVYWIVLLAIVPVLFAIPNLVPVGQNLVPMLLGDLTLLPTHYSTFLTVSWTLRHEVLFYLVFGVAIFNRSLGLAVAGVALLGCFIAGGIFLLGSELNLQATWLVTTTIFSPLHLLFLYGVAVVVFLRKGRLALPALFATAGASLFLATGIYECSVGNFGDNSVIRPQLYGIGSAIAMAGFVELERTGAIQVPGLLTWLGDSSYSLYLIHFPLLSVLAKLIVYRHYEYIFPSWAVFSAMFVVSVVLAIIFHILVEKPLLRWLS